jgi:hypothetical protein
MSAARNDLETGPGWRRCSQWNVRFGSKADMCAAKTHVRFTPNSDRESGFSQTVMSALPPKADTKFAIETLLQS